MGRFQAILVQLLILLGTATAAMISGNGDVVLMREGQKDCEEKYAKLVPPLWDPHTLCLRDHEDAHQVELDDADKQHVLDLHNDYRRNAQPPASDMHVLVWDKTLERTAKKWAMQCPTTHDKNRRELDWNMMDIGQNIALGHKTWDSAMRNFWNEHVKKNYIYGAKYTRRAGYGHYVQLVTAQTIRIGCGRSYCPKSKFRHFLVCNYAHSLNAGYQPYKVGPPCGDCPNNCANGLCDCGNKLCVNGRLNVKDCSCNCTNPLYTGDTCSEVKCPEKDPYPCHSQRASDCGKASMVADPALCPHLCGICTVLCGGKTCESGGELDPETCRCDCTGRSGTGDRCEKNCAEYMQTHGIDCGANGTPVARDNAGCECQCDTHYLGEKCDVKYNCMKRDNEAVCGMFSCRYPGPAARMPNICRDERCDSVKAICPHCCGLCQSA